MREIKFRAWDKLTRRWLDIVSLVSSEDGEIIAVRTREGELITKEGNLELVEWTGLHDKNGKEIYEGDIVHTFSRVGRGFRDRGVDKIHYSDITARWYPLDIVVTEMCEIIGNIYENPELLEN